MGKKWGSNEDIRIGDVFECWDGPDMLQPDSDYYQVVALRGKTQVVLRPLQMETYINEGIAEDSPLHWRRERKRPLPGRFMTAEHLTALVRYERGKEIRRTGEEVTAWVLPDHTIQPCAAGGLGALGRGNHQTIGERGPPSGEGFGPTLAGRTERVGAMEQIQLTESRCQYDWCNNRRYCRLPV